MNEKFSTTNRPEFLMDDIQHVVMPISETPMKPITLNDICEKSNIDENSFKQKFSTTNKPEFLMDDIVHITLPVSDKKVEPITINHLQPTAIPDRFLNQSKPELLMDNLKSGPQIVNFVMPVSETPIKSLNIDDVLGKVKDLKDNENLPNDSTKLKNK